MVSDIRVSPRGCRPAEFTKSLIWIVPTCVAADWPGRTTLTMPSWPIVMLCAPAGMVMPGCST